MWLSYLVQVQAVCLRMISHKLSNALRVSQRSVLANILKEAMDDYENVEAVGREVNKLYDLLLLLDFCYNGILSTYFAYIFLNLFLEGDYTVVTFSNISVFIVRHRLCSLSCSSYLAAVADAQQNLLMILSTSALVDKRIVDQVRRKTLTTQ